MNIKTKAIIASTLLTALFAGQSAIAGQASDLGVFATQAEIAAANVTEKVNYDAPAFTNEVTVSGRK
ncbi:hypothetical protein GCM10009133_15990 [Cocleimonas flava]|uniref:Uncharacterized protein n=1 Tax=Cocleimonas flava TaxID=634765 RepID=A0A4R1EXE9_9GAMM|nr:hypothetical protein [Cocleimonas flava]TCJ84529.1 hypothetical protein EV695_2486 [Cocleimonas flava]